jgi:transcriptional regulator with XRE-family HTH domain
MKEQPSAAVLAAKLVARIHEFRVARRLSVEDLAKAADLSPSELITLQEAREDITTDLVDRIARVFNVHPAVLLMCPDEDPMAKLLEEYRDVPKAEFQQIAGELMSRGYRRSKGSA